MSDVDVHVSPEYSDGARPYPIAALWLRGELFDTYPCGIVRRRVKWLPLWVPFNARYDFSMYAQLLCVKQLREFGAKMLAELRGIEAAA